MAAIQGSEGAERTYSVGSLVMRIVPLQKVDDTSTHASALTNVRGYWANVRDYGSVNTANSGCDVGESSGTLTFNLGDNDRTLTTYILSTELE